MMAPRQLQLLKCSLHHPPPAAFGTVGPYVSYKIIARRNSGIRSSLFSLAHILGLVAPKLDHRMADEFAVLSGNIPVSVQLWCNDLLKLYMSPRSKHISKDRWQVALACIVKKEDGAQHEAFLATLEKNPDSPTERDIQVEIRIERTKVVMTVSTLIPALSHMVSDTSSPSDANGKRFALDTVSYSRSSLLGDSEHIVETFTFPPGSQRVNLPQLLVIADLVSNQSDYNLLTKNCYWFAATIIATMQAYINQARNPGSASSNEDEGITGKGNTTLVNDRQVEKGKWHGIQIISNNTIQAVTQSTLTAFNEKWDKFVHEIQEVIDMETKYKEAEEQASNMETKYKEAEEQASNMETKYKEAEERARNLEEELKILRAALGNQTLESLDTQLA